MQTKLFGLLVALIILCQACIGLVSARDHGFHQKNSASGKKKASSAPLGEHYLMLVNTAIAFQITEEKLRLFDKSPYDGIAVAFLHAYDTSAPPAVPAMDQQIAAWKKWTGKDIWPWVYVNRMIGMSVAENNPHSNDPYFKKIPGADLDDKYGARSDFLQLWRNSLTAARDSSLPGVIFDFEFYNYYKEYDISEVARLTGKTPSAAAESLKALGATMADSAAEIYPNSMLWLFATGLTHAGYKTLDGIPFYPSPTYIVIGLLDEINAKKLPLKVLAGGEGSIGYCHKSVDEFKQSIQKRQSDLASVLRKYDGILELGGTLALWSDRQAKKDWLVQDSCKASDADTIEDLQPYIELLLSSYRYNWLYASGDGNYYPFSLTSAPRFDGVIRKAKAHAGIASLQGP